jgi:alkanesulfonate monooxygenase SsuD/methylene tetrahydromethanopterin reductase-like flavin-dependent oxidoreductase (luciferase family)
MRLALLLPNLRDTVTPKELEDLTLLAEQLDFDSVWAVDRVIVPESNDREELRYSFGMMEGLPHGIPVNARGDFYQGWPLIPWLLAKTTKIRMGMSVINLPYRSPAILATEYATVDNLSGGRLNVGIGSGWMYEEFEAVGAKDVFPRRHAYVREALDMFRGAWDNELFEYHGEFADFGPSGFGVKPVQAGGPPIYFSGLKNPEISAKRIAKYNLAGWIGIQDTPAGLQEWRVPIAAELEKVGRSIDDLDVSSMMWFMITDTETDQTDNGKASNILIGTAAQIEDNLKRLAEAGLDMPMIWPPFRDVPTSKSMDDMKRLAEEILPKVNAG